MRDGGGDKMSTEKNKAVVRRFVEEFKNRANHDIVYELFTPDFIHHLKLPGIPQNREGTRMLGKGVVAAFPDVHATIEELIAEGDRVVERTSARATSKGVFNGIPPTGKPVAWTEIHIYRFKDGKIAEHWGEIDFLGLMGQLGAFPPPKSPG
jgi:predicted ester cyclase